MLKHFYKDILTAWYAAPPGVREGCEIVLGQAGREAKIELGPLGCYAACYTVEKNRGDCRPRNLYIFHNITEKKKIGNRVL